MRVLAVDDAAAWLRERGLQLEPALAWGHDHQLLLPAAYEALRFTTPRDGRGQLGLAYLLARWLECSGALLLVNVVALFQPHELDAFLSLRHYYGDTRWIDGVPGGATPGHLFADGAPHDERNIRDFLAAMFAFIFQGYVVQADSAVIVWVADGVVDIRARDSSRLAGARDIVRTLGIKTF
jgi:hypothetical protein